MKTPEELAEEYVHTWWGPREDNMTLATRQSFLAGYQAGYESLRDQIQFLESQLRQANNMVMKLEAEK
jgi:hypothetical protein